MRDDRAAHAFSKDSVTTVMQISTRAMRDYLRGSLSIRYSLCYTNDGMENRKFTFFIIVFGLIVLTAVVLRVWKAWYPGLPPRVATPASIR